MQNQKGHLKQVLALLFALVGSMVWANLPESYPNSVTSPVQADSLAPSSQGVKAPSPIGGGQTTVNSLYAQFRAGAPFSQEEIKLLIRFGSGETLNGIEVDTLISRVLYMRFVSKQQRLNPQQKDLLRRYKEMVIQSGRHLATDHGQGESQSLGGAETLLAQAGTPCPTSAGLISQLGTPCATYNLTQSTGNAIVPGTTDTGNHCDDCTTAITLPFPFRFYNKSFTTARVSSNGNLQFASNNDELGGCLPQAFFSYTIFAYYSDLYTAAGSGLGVFTSVSGSAPNRIFNIEWRTRFCCSTGPPVQNFEIRLHEGSGRFDIVYGILDASHGGFATVGIQRDTSCFFQYECNTTNSVSTGLMLTFVDYDMCLQDQSNGNILLFNSMTGCYIFTQCSTGFIMTGTGTVTTQGCTTTLQDSQPDRNLMANVNSCTRQGNAVVYQIMPRKVTVTRSILDNNIDDNTCACP